MHNSFEISRGSIGCTQCLLLSSFYLDSTAVRSPPVRFTVVFFSHLFAAYKDTIDKKLLKKTCHPLTKDFQFAHVRLHFFLNGPKIYPPNVDRFRKGLAQAISKVKAGFIVSTLGQIEQSSPPSKEDY